MSEKNWTCKYAHHGRRNGEGFPRHTLKDFDGTHISMGMLRSYNSKYSWDYRNYPAITSKYIVGLLDKYVGKSYDDFKLAFDQRTKNLYKKYPIEWGKISDYLFDKPQEYYHRTTFYLDKNNIIRRCKKLKYRTWKLPTLSKTQKHFNERVKFPEWEQVRTDSRFDVDHDSFSTMPDKFREPLLLGTFYVVVNEKVCKLPVYTCNKEIFKTYSTYRDEKWDSKKRRYIKTPFWKSDAWNCKFINPAKRRKIAEQWIPIDVYILPKLKHDFWCEAKHKDRYNLEERIENLNNKINNTLDFNIRLELIGDRNKLIHQLNELPETACYNLGYGRYYPFVKVSDYEKFCNK